MENTNRKMWSIMIKVVIAIASALLGALGGAEATTMFMS